MHTQMFQHVTWLSLTMFLAITLGGCFDTGGSEPGITDTTTDPIAITQNSAVGCYSASFSALDSSQIGCGLITTFGDPLFDQQFTQEINIQSTFWTGIPATVFAFNECSPDQRNAYAMPNAVIMIGYYMVQDLVFNTGSTLPVAGVMAHEWGHQVQFQNNWMNSNEPTVRRTELEADMWSGFYMALAKAWTGTELNAYFQFLFGSGDFNFHDPGHHGTPNQRLAAGSVGFDVGYQVAVTGQRLSYFELHDIFEFEVSRITSTISGKSNSVDGAAKSLTVAAEQVAAGIDRRFADEVLAGKRSLDSKQKSLAHVPEQTRFLFAPY